MIDHEREIPLSIYHVLVVFFDVQRRRSTFDLFVSKAEEYSLSLRLLFSEHYLARFSHFELLERLLLFHFALYQQ